MLRNILGQTWVLVAVIVLGATVLFWLFRRRGRAEAAKGRPQGAMTRPTVAARPAPATTMPAPGKASGRKPLWPGYRGVEWGQPPVEGMTVVHEEEETRFLVRPTDEPRIGNVHIGSAAYSFRLNRLEAVVIDLPLPGFEPLARHLSAEWGPPRSTPDRSRHVWSDSGSGPEATQAVLEKRAESHAARRSTRIGS